MIDLGELCGRAMTGDEVEGSSLLCDPGGDIDETNARSIARWFSTLPCPVVAVTGTAHPLIAAACDVICDHEAAADIAKRIAANPQAALVLVQLLRASEHAGIDHALTMESMAYGLLQSGPDHKRWLSVRTRGQGLAADNAPPVQVTRDDDRLKVVLDRPSHRNALSTAMRDALCEAFSLAVMDDGIRTVYLSGAGGCFSIGGDLNEFGRVTDPVSGHVIRSMRSPARLLAACADKVEVKVHSACIGAGVELMAFAKKVVAAENAFFQLPELEMGLIPGAGGCVSVPRRIGRQRAAFMALSGKRINARTALAWGLVDAVES
jgi:enoyl-CoA hydratase/carnithine racemase